MGNTTVIYKSNETNFAHVFKDKVNAGFLTKTHT